MRIFCRSLQILLNDRLLPNSNANLLTGTDIEDERITEYGTWKHNYCLVVQIEGLENLKEHFCAASEYETASQEW